jgi:Protein of unknown function DUF262
MTTTATNRKIRELLTQLLEGKLEPRPEFQRRLVWSNKDKSSFLETVLLNLPFPEIYVAAGSVDLETGEGKEMLVDGQQRITTLFQYLIGSQDLQLTSSVKTYKELSRDEKEAFLQYDVVVRDLGRVEINQIREVFRRINATSYALNAMEIHNARYEGEYKQFAELIAQNDFFDRHRVFRPSEIRRMQDTRFAIVFITTILSTYFHRDDTVEDFLIQYNDEFPLRHDTEKEVNMVLGFVDSMNLPPESRAWKRADLFTLLVEVHDVLVRKKKQVDPQETARRLLKFYNVVDERASQSDATDRDDKISRYYKSALQATNDRSSRITRGNIIREILLGEGS